MKHSPDTKPQPARKIRTCRLSEDEYNYLSERHNGLSAAIRLLTKGGKYEQLLNQVTDLQTKLQEIQK